MRGPHGIRTPRFLSFACAAFLSTPLLLRAAEPGQFIAKMYSEALGRVPDQGGWQLYKDYFVTNGCSVVTVRAVGNAFFVSGEFLGLNYDNPAKLLTLYRGALNREPWEPDYSSWLGQLDGGTPWSSVVDAFFNRTEFIDLVPSICSSGGVYHWGSGVPINIPTAAGGDFAGGTGDQLQALLTSTPSGGVVRLNQRGLTRVTAPLTIPDGVTLTTFGATDSRHYASMGRLIRAANFPGDGAPLIRLNPGSRLDRVWVDGQLNNLLYKGGDLNIQTLGGFGTAVTTNRVDNASGFTQIQSFGPCSANLISFNVVTGYAHDHFAVPTIWADGLTMGCADTMITNNEVIDPTDVGIVLFPVVGTVQASKIQFNTVLNAGNSAWAAFAMANRPEAGTDDYSQTEITNNLFWTSSTAHMDIGISVGSHAWQGTGSLGIGATVNNNTTGTDTARTNNGIVVSGMLNAEVLGNTAFYALVNTTNCPVAHVAASVSAGTAVQISRRSPGRSHLTH